MSVEQIITYVSVAVILILSALYKIGTSVKDITDNKPTIRPVKPWDEESEEESEPEETVYKQTTVRNITSPGNNTEIQIRQKESKEKVEPVILETEIDKDLKDIKEHFNLKKAIIYKEILEPKYKEY